MRKILGLLFITSLLMVFTGSSMAPLGTIKESFGSTVGVGTIANKGNSLNPTTDYASITDFGAKNDPEFDSTAAIKKCIDYCQSKGIYSIYAPAGTYKITGKIVIPSKFNLYGAGRMATTFVGHMDAPVFEVHRDEHTLSGFTVKYENGWAPKPGQNAILLYQVRNSKFDDINFFSVNRAIFGDDTLDGNYQFSCQFSNMYIYHYATNAIYLKANAKAGGNTGVVISNIYTNNWDGVKRYNRDVVALYLDTFSEVTVTQFNAEWVYTSSGIIDIRNCRSATFISTHIEGVHQRDKDYFGLILLANSNARFIGLDMYNNALLSQKSGLFRATNNSNLYVMDHKENKTAISKEGRYIFSDPRYMDEIYVENYKGTVIPTLGYVDPNPDGSQKVKQFNRRLLDGPEYRTSAGNPNRVLTPYFIGEECLDTKNGIWYKAKGTLNTDWVALN